MNIDDISLMYSSIDFKVEDKKPLPVLPLKQSSIDKVVDVLKVKKVAVHKEIVLAAGLSKSTVSRIVCHLKSINSVSIVDVPESTIVTFIKYDESHTLIYTLAYKKQLPRQESINTVISILKTKRIMSTKDITLITGLSGTTVRGVMYYLNEINAITFLRSRRKIVVTFLKYTKPLAAIKEEKEYLERSRSRGAAVDEYIGGGVTFQYLADKYSINIAIIHKLVSEKRGINNVSN